MSLSPQSEMRTAPRWSIDEDLFSFKYKFTKWDYLKFALATVTIFPLRVIIMFTAIIQAYFVCLFLYLTTKTYPYSGITKNVLVPFVEFLGDVLLFSLGFTDIRIKGKLASKKDAPILIIGPHTSFFDGLVITKLKKLSIVSKRVNPFTIHGAIMQLCQPVLVDREDKTSKSTAILSINKRIASKKDWPRLALFPEGMVSNSKAMLMFRKGAFNPGVPIQGLLINYYPDYDTYSWCYGGPGPLVLLWMTMCNLKNRMDITILPPYIPSKEEGDNASLYAHNVRDYMVEEANILKNNLSYEYYNLTYRAMNNRIPYFAFISDYIMFWKSYCKDPKSECSQEELNQLYSLSRMNHVQSLNEVEHFYQLKHTNVSNFEALNFYLHHKRKSIDFKRFLSQFSMLFHKGLIKERIAKCLEHLNNLQIMSEVGPEKVKTISRETLANFLEDIYRDEKYNHAIIEKLSNDKESFTEDEILRVLDESEIPQLYQDYREFLSTECQQVPFMYSSLA